jgi:hypothetical protein
MGFLIFILYFFKLILALSLKIEEVISFKEKIMVTSRIIPYTFCTILIFIPQAKAFLIFYNLLKFFFDKNNLKKNYKIYVFTFFVILILFILRYSILIFIGYSYLVLITSSFIVLNIFSLIRFNFESKKALMQHILLNCFLINTGSIGKAITHVLYINENNTFRFNSDPKIFNKTTEMVNKVVDKV